jgi:hypothetical protein
MKYEGEERNLFQMKAMKDIKWVCEPKELEKLLLANNERKLRALTHRFSSFTWPLPQHSCDILCPKLNRILINLMTFFFCSLCTSLFFQCYGVLMQTQKIKPEMNV